MEKERPKVGIGVIVKYGDKILIGERLKGHGNNTFMIPGGHLEFGESFEDCARREVMEETGLSQIKILGVVSLGNNIAYDKHYISIGVLAEYVDGELGEEEGVATNWKWMDPRKLPEPFFEMSRKVVKNWLHGAFYSDN
jgi:8-oxo-dGTP diphosphatase